MTKTYYSHGKLLLTAEYLVVDGANALALPCKFGQELLVETEVAAKGEKPKIAWKSLKHDGTIWFSGVIELSSIINTPFKIIESSNNEMARRLIQILEGAFTLNPKAFQNNISIETKLEFPQYWGLGSSSTLIGNLAQWLKIDPFKLFFLVSKGSGYDVACATSSGPLIYNRNNNNPVVTPVAFNPNFKDEIYFLHLGAKQDSFKEVKRFEGLSFNKKVAIDAVNKLTNKILVSNNLSEFEKLVVQHEELLSDILKIPTVKSQYFNGYKGVVKSLGAWGGDFVLLTKRPGMADYFSRKGYKTLLSFNDMIYVG